MAATYCRVFSAEVPTTSWTRCLTLGVEPYVVRLWPPPNNLPVGPRRISGSAGAVTQGLPRPSVCTKKCPIPETARVGSPIVRDSANPCGEHVCALALDCGAAPKLYSTDFRGQSRNSRRP